MGLVELFVYILVTAILGWLAIWVLGKLAPGHPAIIDNAIWVVVVLVIVVVVFQALGGHLPWPRVPQVLH